MNIPQNIKNAIDLFHSAKLNYNLFKCEHIFAGENKNLDILFKTTLEYERAGRLLEEEGFILVFSEKFELYKQMYIKFSMDSFTAIHLHREISWHGINVLNKERIFNNARKITNGIFVPSFEDSLIIHIIHVLFENFKIRKRDAEVIGYYLQQNLNWSYINQVLEKEHLKNNFYYIKTMYEKKLQPKKTKLYMAIISHIFIFKQKSSLIPLIKKLLRKVNQKLLFKRSGCLITLIGVNGSGKTTATAKLSEIYEPITGFLSGQQVYYFGWHPFSFPSKIASEVLKKLNIKMYDRLNKDKNFSKEVKTDVNLGNKPGFLEILFYIYNYFEYLLRYYRRIYPCLRKRKLVITDRYFYDFYGQYKNARNSRLLKYLIHLFPKPDYVFILNAPLRALRSRGKQPHQLVPNKRSSVRNVYSEEVLQSQIDRFNELSEIINAKILHTLAPIDENINLIISSTWKYYSLRAV